MKSLDYRKGATAMLKRAYGDYMKNEIVTILDVWADSETARLFCRLQNDLDHDWSVVPADLLQLGWVGK